MIIEMGNYKVIVNNGGIMVPKEENYPFSIGKLEDVLKTKTKASPFGRFPGETIRVLNPKKRTTFIEVQFLLERKIVGELHVQILKAINELRFATSKQVTEYLNLRGIAVLQKEIKNCLKLLWRKGFVRKFDFSDGNGRRSSYKVYLNARHGCELLKGKGEEIVPHVAFASCKIDYLKRVLASNQVMLEMERRYGICPKARSTCLSADNRTETLCRIEGIYDEANYSLLLDVMRQWDQNDEEALKEHWNRVYELVKHYDKCVPVSLSHLPLVIVVGENLEHVRFLQKSVQKNCPMLPVIYTWDALAEQTDQSVMLFKSK